MSGLAGVWNLDGRPADRAIVTSMASAIAHRGRDHSGIWCGGPVGFACRLLRVTPESVGECQPATDRLGTVLLFDGRLDNRQELLATTPGAQTSSDCPDSVLVLAAWRAWGEGFLGRLQGDYALAVFDARINRLVLARDAVGCRPLYYWSDGRSLVFGSEIKAILAHPDVTAKPNEDLLADFFLLERLPYEDEGETFFHGVHAVLPGYALNVTPAGLRSARFWDFNPRALLRYASQAEYAEHLRELLVEAVKRRLRTRHPVVVATSGGLDSSVVLCIADQLRRNGAVDVPLLAASYTPSGDPASEENRFITLLESHRGLPVHRLAPGEPDAMPQLRRTAWHSEVPAFDDGWCAQDPLVAFAGESGARTLLSGLWSDQICFVTGYLSDLSMRLAWRQVARHLAEYAQWFPDADPAYFRNRFGRELCSHLTPGAVRGWLRPFRKALPWMCERTATSAALSARLRRRRPRIDHPAFGSVHARTVYQTIRARSQRLQVEADEKVVAERGVEHVTPFLDRDVIAYLMSVPGEVLNRGGVPRGLLRDAMIGIVPPAILRRRWRNEGSTSQALERDRRRTCLAAGVPLRASTALGYFSEARSADADSREFVGLELWSQLYFSDTLHRSEEGEQ